MPRRLRVGLSWGWNNTVECMANPASAICLADGRTFERFALTPAADQIELVDLTGMEYGVYKNGTFTGDLSAIIDGTVDTLMDSFVMSARKSRFFDQTVPFIKPTFAFLTTPKPVQLSSLYKLFGPFNWRVWLLVAISLCILSVGDRLVKLFQEKNGKIKRSEIFHALTVDTEHANSIRPSTATQTMLIVLYIIAVTTFTAAYQGALLQTLLVDEPNIYSVDEVIQQIENGERQLVVESVGYYFTDEIEHAREMNNSNDMSVFARLARATSNNPIVFYKNETDALDGVAMNRYILLHMTHLMEDTLKVAKYRSYEQCDQFDLIHVDDDSEHWLGMLVRRGDRRSLNTLNNIILSMYGRQQAMADGASDPECVAALRSNWLPQVGYKRISLYDVSTLLLTYIIGCILTIFCCGLESVFIRHRTPTVQQNNSSPRKVHIELQPVDGDGVIRLEYCLIYEIDLEKLQQDIHTAIRRNYITRI